jgi:hypothetical protein
MTGSRIVCPNCVEFNGNFSFQIAVLDMTVFDVMIFRFSGHLGDGRPDPPF